MTTLIKNGTVVTSTGRHDADVLIDGEKIAAILQPGTSAATSAETGAEKVIDATGKYVVPGGIDCHTHMELPFGGTFASDTFEIGTRAAAWGGTTTIIDFAVQKYEENVRECLDSWFAKAEGECAIDYAFHMILGGVDDAALKEMDALVDEGITSFKLFMAYPGVFYSDDGQILKVMQKASENGAMICMHAENGIAIDVIAEQAASRGQTDPIYHGITRPSRLEGEATNRAIQLALVAGAPVYFVHLSASEALERVAAARNEGHNVYAETCPQYLYLNLEDHLGAPGFAGAGYVCSPPLRTKEHTHHKDLWRGLRTNDLAVVSTDHCPFCMKEQKELVETCSTTPARMFGLYPQKGVIAAGSDADIVLYNPNAKTHISVDTHHMSMDYSAYEGFDIDGHVDTVISRGKVLIEDGAYHGAKGDGRYLRRGLSSYLI